MSSDGFTCKSGGIDVDGGFKDGFEIITISADLFVIYTHQYQAKHKLWKLICKPMKCIREIFQNCVAEKWMLT